MPCIPAAELADPTTELKKRKKLEPTSMALPASSAASIAFTEVIPLLPSGIGQSACCMISTGLTSHQIGLVLTRLLSTTWLWLGVGTNKGAIGGLGMPGIQVPGTGLFASGHCVWTLGVV